MYNYEWFLGDRTSIVSSGWFEFFDIEGQPILSSNPTRPTNDPFGLNVINAGFVAQPAAAGQRLSSATRSSTPGRSPPRPSNSAYSYWLSPKWYASFATSYDFGNAILLGSTFSITRIGADFLTSVGLTVDPQRQSYMFGFEIAPRFSPNVRFGSAGGITRFDSRFAPYPMMPRKPRRVPIRGPDPRSDARHRPDRRAVPAARPAEPGRTTST